MLQALIIGSVGGRIETDRDWLQRYSIAHFWILPDICGLTISEVPSAAILLAKNTVSPKQVVCNHLTEPPLQAEPHV